MRDLEILAKLTDDELELALAKCHGSEEAKEHTRKLVKDIREVHKFFNKLK